MKVCLIASHPLFFSYREIIGAGAEITCVQLHPRRFHEQLEKTSAVSHIYVIDAAGPPSVLDTVIETVHRSNPDSHVIVVGDTPDPDGYRLLSMGVKGIIKYGDVNQQLRRAIDAVHSGGYWVPRSLLSHFVDSIVRQQRVRALPVRQPVTRREGEILGTLLQNLSNKEIAAKFNLSERTVKFHVSRLLAKHQVQRRADLIVLFFQTRGCTSASTTTAAGEQL